MKENPHDYQRYSAEFIITHPITALLLGMGLGKTSITLTAINNLLFDSFEVHKVLVVAPLRVARDTWSAEIEKWEHLKNLRYSVDVGSEQERILALRIPASNGLMDLFAEFKLLDTGERLGRFIVQRSVSPKHIGGEHYSISSSAFLILTARYSLVGISILKRPSKLPTFSTVMFHVSIMSTVYILLSSI